eukprot:CAMPEP_0198152710 /NCGR_PEP_ID=MMETSP1443-20131203/60935_1 /TAXON_ID=186043 /ORGANISM="Entomoneis sp., Strain CCMP2396" /LENGTH=242 /DNA_ID=CAMNT_0043818813 /DNA_START=165 /DNA_END=893 /DNA_ORIENTATION=+
MKTQNRHHQFATAVSFDYAKIRQEICQEWMKQQGKSPQGLATTGRYYCFTLEDAQRAYKDPQASWHRLDREMSSNVAGETGAVYIYKGALAAMSIRPVSADAYDFCHEHQATEQSHLDIFSNLLVDGKYTKLLPFWRVAGWTLGFIPALVGGSKALYVTVEAVETFVEQHFQEQIWPLEESNSCPELLKVLKHCCEDEVHHKEDAAKRLLLENADLTSWWIRPWALIVKQGSSLAAELARRI